MGVASSGSDSFGSKGRGPAPTSEPGSRQASKDGSDPKSRKETQPRPQTRMPQDGEWYVLPTSEAPLPTRDRSGRTPNSRRRREQSNTHSYVSHLSTNESDPPHDRDSSSRRRPASIAYPTVPEGRWRDARKRQDAQRAKLAKEEADRKLLSDPERLMAAKSKEARTFEGVRLLPWRSTNLEEYNQGKAKERPRLQDSEQQREQEREEEEAEFREEERAREREKRDEAMRERRRARALRKRHADMSWFWVSQTDALAGVWATPWKSLFYDHTCIGAIAVAIEALMGFTDTASFRYESRPHLINDGFQAWIESGDFTYPSYAINARGGVIVGGSYELVAYQDFKGKLPPIRLLGSYDSQVDSYRSRRDQSFWWLSELMWLDTWLSFAGRAPEIVDGRQELLKRAPLVIDWIMVEFESDFEAIDRSANEGGLQLIQEITENLLDRMADWSLSLAEQLFILVGVLRTAKVGLCIALGQDTSDALDILYNDIQVYFT